MRYDDLADADCGIAQTLGIMGDGWTWLIVREVAGGITRFDALQHALRISRRALSERLASLVDQGMLRRQQYSAKPPRYDYVLTRRGEGLLPVLVAMQEFGDRFVLGDASVTATAEPKSREASRVHGLVGRTVPDVVLPAHDGSAVPARGEGWRVLFFFPGAFAPDAEVYPPAWAEIPGATGCTLESRTYASRQKAFAALGCELYGVSTQRPDQQAAFASWASLPFQLLSDQDLRMAAALRLPLFRVAGMERYKRQSLLLGPGGVVRHAQMPITDPAGSVDEMLDRLTALKRSSA